MIGFHFGHRVEWGGGSGCYIPGCPSGVFHSNSAIFRCCDLNHIGVDHDARLFVVDDRHMVEYIITYSIFANHSFFYFDSLSIEVDRASVAPRCTPAPCRRSVGCLSLVSIFPSDIKRASRCPAILSMRHRLILVVCTM